MAERRKAIEEGRDELQSRLLTVSVALVLTGACLAGTVLFHTLPIFKLAFAIGLTFGLIVWALRAGTFSAAFCGAILCMLVTVGTATGSSPFFSGLTPLTALFILTFLATHTGKRRKRGAGLAEHPRGRKASQVIANLGVAGLVVIGSYSRSLHSKSHGDGTSGPYLYATAVMVLAVFAEATADTVASELGQAFGGQPVMLWTHRPVAPGTDGAVTALGTAAGLVGAAIVVLSGAWSMHLARPQCFAALLGGTAGLFFDSLLGATVESRGWLGNDLVNFASTVFAAAVAFAVLALR